MLILVMREYLFVAIRMMMFTGKNFKPILLVITKIVDVTLFNITQYTAFKMQPYSQVNINFTN